MIYVICPSSWAVDKEDKLNECFLKALAKVQEFYGDEIVVSVSLLGYSIVPYLQNGDATYATWEARCHSAMAAATKVAIIDPGWSHMTNSRGCRAEVQWFVANRSQIDWQMFNKEGDPMAIGFGALPGYFWPSSATLQRTEL